MNGILVPLPNVQKLHLKSTGIGDTAFFGPEPEFFIFDGVSWETSMDKVLL